MSKVPGVKLDCEIVNIEFQRTETLSILSKEFCPTLLTFFGVAILRRGFVAVKQD